MNNLEHLTPIKENQLENSIETTEILRPQLEKLTPTEEEILNQTNPLTPEEKKLALRVIRIITSKNPKDKHLVINYNILYSHPPKEDKEGIIAQLQEEIKFNRKVIAEYKELKEKYLGEIVELRKVKNDVSE